MASLLDLIPTRLLFVVVFGLLPVVLTVHEVGFENVTRKEWASFGLVVLGVILVYWASTVYDSIGMQRYLWPLLVLMGLGFLLYRESLDERGEWDESTVQRGGASYDD